MDRFNPILGVLLAGLLATAAFEFTARAPSSGNVTGLPTSASPGAPATTTGAEPTATYIEQVLARPLFTEGRRPAAADSPAPVAQAPAGRIPRLSGILVTGNDRRAIFESGDKPVVGVVGTQMGAYRILAITSMRVTLQGPGGVEAVSLSYGPAAGNPASPATPTALDQAGGGTRLPPGTPQTPTFQDMLANLAKTAPPTVTGPKLDEVRAAR